MDVCIKCGKLPTQNGHYETVMMIPADNSETGFAGFRHGNCDLDWDEPEAAMTITHAEPVGCQHTRVRELSTMTQGVMKFCMSCNERLQ